MQPRSGFKHGPIFYDDNQYTTSTFIFFIYVYVYCSSSSSSNQR